MSNVTINDTAVNNLFEALNDNSRKQILFTALKTGGDVLLNNAKTSLRSKLGAGATTPNRWNGKTMESGIKLNADKDYCEVDVHIMGDFRLKFFEKGTITRYTRRTKANRGNIKALNFFAAARANEGEITDIINSSIEESLKRITKQ